MSTRDGNQVFPGSVMGLLVPIPPGSHALARAFYNYEVLVTYADATGHTTTITLISGPRWQGAFVSPDRAA